MPRTNMQILGLIELDLPPSGAIPNFAARNPGLWQDLARLAVPPDLVTGDAVQESDATLSDRWDRAGDPQRQDLLTAPTVFADLPRLRRELDAELRCFVKRIYSARDD